MNQGISFGNFVRQRRRELDLTQDELARRVGCAAITLRKIESDDLRASIQIAERLAMALAILLDERADFVRRARAVRPEAADPPAITPAPALEEIGRDDLTGRAIRGYALAERIGKGGMGSVYRAVQPNVEREVAVKIILPMYANHPDFIRRFEAEAQLVARLEHPHIVPLYDYWREPGVAYLVMRLLRGGSVQNLIGQGPLSIDTTTRLLEQICSALNAAHRMGVIHRDLKPANVLLDEDNNAYLADFGIAKNISNPEMENLTRMDAMIGSPQYMSPEQIQSLSVRPQTDIYCLGIMLYEMLTGALPFAGPTPIDLIQQHVNTPMPPLAAHQTGLPGQLDRIIGRATAKNPNERYEDALSLYNDFLQAVSVMPNARPLSLSDEEESDLEIANPFKGLRAFGEADAENFFGRETLVQQLLARVGEGGDLRHFLAVIGPSGSGKSSVVRAGLIPALRRGGLPGSENWFIVDMLPGKHPFEELEACLLRVAVNPPEHLLSQMQDGSRGLLRAVNRILPADETVELVLVIDQFEEVFTLVEDEAERVLLLENLATAALDEHSRLHVLITLRADFTDKPLRYVDFGELINRRFEFVLPLTPDELERAVSGPARRVGLSLEKGLVSTIMREVGNQPGALPLLQYALSELYDKRDGRTLTQKAYQEIGGVLGALSKSAETIYAGLDAESQSAARQMFLRLVTLGEGTEDTRRRVLREEIEALQGDQNSSITKAIETFGKARLLSFDRDPLTHSPTLELAHEALIREWARLREWLTESRSDVRAQRQLAIAASDWNDARQDTSFLLSGARLEQFAGWATNTSIALTQAEQAFLTASLAERDRRVLDEQARQRRELESAQKLAETERQATLRLQGRNRIITGALAAAIILAYVAVFFGYQANRNAREALASEKIAQSRELAAASIANLEIDPERSILLALQGLSIQNSSEAETALRRGLATSRVKLTLASDPDTFSLAFSQDGKQMATGDKNGLIQIWDIQTGQKLIRLNSNPASSITGMYYTRDGNQLVAADSTGFIKIWNVSTGKLNSSILAYPGEISSIAFNVDGGRLATTNSTTIKIWDINTSKELFDLSGTANISSVAFSRDGTRLATASDDDKVIIWDTATGKNLFTFVLGPDGCTYPNIVFNKVGTRLISSDNCGAIRFWDISSNKGQELFHRNVPTSNAPVSLDLSPDGTRLAVSDTNSISIWDASIGFDLFVLPFHQVTYFTGGFSPDGKLFAAGGYGAPIKVWDMSSPGKEEIVVTAHNGKRVGDVIFSPDGTQVLTESFADGKIRMWDPTTGQKLQEIADPDICCAIAFNPSGTQLVIGSKKGVAQIRDPRTGKLEMLLSGHTNSIVTVAFNPDGTKIATESYDGTVKIWDAKQGKELISINVRIGGQVADVAFSPDGKLLATSSADKNIGNGQVIVWDAATGKQLFYLGNEPDAPAPWGLSFNPDGNLLAVGYSDQVVRVWDVSTLKSQTQPLQILRGHSNLVWEVAFSPDGTRLATASHDGTVKLWKISSGSVPWTEITTLTGHTAEVSGIAFSPDGKFIASVSWDGTLRVYFNQNEGLIATAKKRVTRTLTTEECQQYLHVDACPPAP